MASSTPIPYPLRIIISIVDSHRPSISLNLQNSILAYIVELLAGTADYHLKQRALSSKRKREAKHTEGAARKKARVETDAGMNVDETLAASDGKAAPASATTSDGVDVEMTSASPKPLPPTSNPTIPGDATKPDDSHRLMHHITFGINAVTKRLETQMQSARRPMTTIPENAAPLSPPLPLKYVFVCRADVDPKLLVDHFPHLVAGFNSTRPAQPVKLVPLPKGAELALAEALAVRRVTVLAVDVRL
jgi:ribonuclease P/MRP protein subunit POP3